MHTKAKILIVDGDAVVLRTTSQLLESHGYQTQCATDGEQALRLAQIACPDLALVNIQLPDMDGFEVCRRIKASLGLADVFVVIALSEQTAVLGGGEIASQKAHSGKVALGSARNDMAGEADGYIVRPITNRALFARMQAMLNQRSVQVAVRQKENELNQRLKEMAALNAIGQQINLLQPLDVTLSKTVDVIITAVQPDRAFIFMVEGESLLLKASRDIRGPDFFQGFPEHRVGECLCGLAVSEGRSQYSRDIVKDMRCIKADCRLAGLNSCVVLPLQAGRSSEILGVLGLSSVAERDFEQQAAFLQTLAAQVSLGVQNAHLYEAVQAERASVLNELNGRKRVEAALQDKNKVMAALQETMLELISEHDLHSLLENIVKRAGQLVGTESGFLDLVESGDVPRLKPQVGLGALSDSLKYENQLGEGIAGVVWQTGRPLLIENYDTWMGRVGDYQHGKLRAAVGVPLLSGASNRVVGVLGLAYSALEPGLFHLQPDTRRFGPEALELLVQFARLAVIAIENARLFDALQQELVERSRAERARSVSEEHFRIAFNTSPDSININRLSDGVYVDINEGFTALTGYTREDVIGRSSLEINIWHDPSDRARLVAGLREHGEVRNLEAKFRVKDGHLVTALMSARFILLDDVAHILSITRDIDEIKRAGEALEESERKFRSVVESSPTGMHYYHLESDNRLILLDANPAADRINGFSHQALLGLTIEAAFPALAATEYPELYKKVARGEVGPQAFEIQYSDERMGGYFDVHVFQTAPGFILVDFIDISERKHTEQALFEREFWLRESQRVGQIGSYILDIANDNWACSDVLDDILGIEPFSEKTLLSWNSLIHPDEREAMLAYFTHFVIGEKQSFDKEYRIIRVENGEERWVWGRGELLYDADGAPVRMIGTLQDVTERKQTEELIKKLNTQLEQRVAERTIQLQAANKELEAFAYSVSHDLRTPLRGIDGWSLALLEDCSEQLDEQGHKYLNRVRSETQRMGQLIDDLLQLSRLTRSEMQFAPVDLSALAQGIVERLREKGAQPRVGSLEMGGGEIASSLKNASRNDMSGEIASQRVHSGQVSRGGARNDMAGEIEFIIQPGLVASGDRNLLEIALTNLFDNACKFSGTRPQAKVEFGRTEHDGKLAYFVRDNGVGFDMMYAKKLFGAFQRMHKQSDFSGTGIGLATVQRIIHRHGGMIWADAKPDAGAVFYFTLETVA